MICSKEEIKMPYETKSNVVPDKVMPATPSVEEMRETLAQYYEGAGFADVYNRELKTKPDDEIRQMYRKTFIDE